MRPERMTRCGVFSPNCLAARSATAAGARVAAASVARVSTAPPIVLSQSGTGHKGDRQRRRDDLRHAFLHVPPPEAVRLEMS